MRVEIDIPLANIAGVEIKTFFDQEYYSGSVDGLDPHDPGLVLRFEGEIEYDYNDNALQPEYDHVSARRWSVSRLKNPRLVINE